MQDAADQKHKALDTKIQALIQDDLVTVYERGDNYATLLVQPPSVKKPKHLMHIVLSAVTAGIWVPVYFGLLALDLWTRLEGGRQHLKRIEVLENGSVRESSEPVNGWITETSASTEYDLAIVVSVGLSRKLYLLEDRIELWKRSKLQSCIPREGVTESKDGRFGDVTITDAEGNTFVSDSMIKAEHEKLQRYLAN